MTEGGRHTPLSREANLNIGGRLAENIREIHTLKCQIFDNYSVLATA